jgi:ABC-2 type transport system permease protein
MNRAAVSSTRAPAALTWRLVRRGTIAWSAVGVVSLVAGASVYRTAYATPAARALFAASFGSSRGLDALYGPADRLDTVGGFLWWRYSATLAVVAGLWGVLATTRVLRGDEDQGRAELLLTGEWPPVRLLRTQLAVLLGSVAGIGLTTALACVTSGLGPGVSAAYGAAVFLGGALFVSLAALVSQLVDTRRRAVGLTGSVLAAAYLVRALADGAPDLRWAAWCSPLGWVSRIAPFAESAGASRIVAAALLVAVTAGASAGALQLRQHRDVGAGLLAGDRGSTHQRRMASLGALDRVLGRAGLIGWCVGTAAAGLVLGFIAADIARAVADNASLDEQTASLTGRSLASVRGFVGLSFGLVAVIAALYAGAQVVTARRGEADGTLTNLLTNGVSRRRWYLTRIAGAATTVVVLVMVAALSMWAGVRLSGSPLSLIDGLLGGLNTLPVAATFLGASALCLGLAPRGVAGVAYGSVAAAYTLLLVTSLGHAPRWIIDLSPFSHLSPVPAAPANRWAGVVMVAIGLAAVALGTAGFERRDIAGD